MAINKIKYFILNLLIISSSLSGEVINLDNKKIIEEFSDILFKKSEAGYVFLGKKPLSILGYDIEDHFIRENARHQSSVCLKEGVSLLGPVVNLNEDVSIISYDGEDSLVKNCVHIVVINKPLFIETVNKNIVLFQYVLGPELTAENLLKHLSNPKNRFHEILKNDKVLIGIILGFGTQNALYVSRAENIEDSLWREKLPFKAKISNIQGLRKDFLKSLFLKTQNEPEKASITPNFGYISLEDELAQLTKKIEISSKSLAQGNPPFLFGRLHDDSEVNIEDLEKTQEKIHRWDPTPLFLNPNKREVYLSSDKLPFQVAVSIWKSIKNESENFKKSFVEGMHTAHEGNSPKYAESEYLLAKNLFEIYSNIEKADAVFLELEKDPSYTPVIPYLIYSRVKEAGSGESLNKNIRVKIHYKIYDPHGRCLKDTSESGAEVVYPSELISGLALGMKHMKKHELREIYINPAVAYGVYTTLEKGIYLKAEVRLLDFENPMSTTSYPALEYDEMKLDFHKIAMNLSKEEVKAGYIQGYHVWHHYKKGNYVFLKNVLSWFEQFQKKEPPDLLKEDQEMLNRLHWLIYSHSR